MCMIFIMANDIFDVNDAVFKQLNKFFKDSPKEFQRVTGGVLDSIAFGIRREAIKNIHDKLMVRSDPFVRRGLLVRKSSKSAPIDRQIAKLETNPRVVDTGWTEQEFGAKSKRPYTVSLGARKNKYSRVIPQKFRINKPARKISEFRFNNRGEARRWGFIAMMNRKYKNDPFYLDKRTGTIEKGRMYFGSKSKLYHITNPGRTHQPKKRPWLAPAAQRYMSSSALERLWQKNVLHVFKKNLNI